jgi:protein involved in polysaccharide export with SLBB domain
MRLAVLCGSVVVLGSLMGAFPQVALAGERPLLAQDKIAEDYKVVAGDVLGISVLRHPEFSLNAQVLPDGTFAFPILGRLKAAGKTREQISADIAKARQAGCDCQYHSADSA